MWKQAARRSECVRVMWFVEGGSGGKVVARGEANRVR